MSLKILKVLHIKTENTNSLEVEIEINGEKKTECFDDYDYWMQEENGGKRFITRLKENSKLKIKTEPEEKKTELKQYKNQVIK